MLTSHHGDVASIRRLFPAPARRSPRALDDKTGAEFRWHVWAVTMADESPLPVAMEAEVNEYE